MTESRMRSTVVKALRPYHPVAVENPGCPGTPDLNCTLGWIELKQVDRWPPRGGPLRLPHFTKQQRIWLRLRARAGEMPFVLLHVDGDWMLFTGGAAALKLGHSTKRELQDIAIMQTKKLDAIKLVDAIMAWRG